MARAASALARPDPRPHRLRRAGRRRVRRPLLALLEPSRLDRRRLRRGARLAGQRPGARHRVWKSSCATTRRCRPGRAAGATGSAGPGGEGPPGPGGARDGGGPAPHGHRGCAHDGRVHPQPGDARRGDRGGGGARHRRRAADARGAAQPPRGAAGVRPGRAGRRRGAPGGLRARAPRSPAHAGAARSRADRAAGVRPRRGRVPDRRGLRRGDTAARATRRTPRSPRPKPRWPRRRWR